MIFQAGCFVGDTAGGSDTANCNDLQADTAYESVFTATN